MVLYLPKCNATKILNVPRVEGKLFLVAFQLGDLLLMMRNRLAQFATPALALNAIAMLDKSYFNGRPVHLRLDRKLLDDVADADLRANVFVGNVQWNVDQQELLDLFSPYNPLDCNILTNMYGRSKGFAIVKFARESDAAQAIDALNHVDFHGRQIEVCRLSALEIHAILFLLIAMCIVSLRSRYRQTWW